jgi:hypothetical protein
MILGDEKLGIGLVIMEARQSIGTLRTREAKALVLGKGGELLKVVLSVKNQ